MGWGNKAKRRTAAGLATVVGVAVAAQAQNANDGGLRADLTVSQRLTFSDNPEFVANGSSGVESLTDLSFALASTTRTQRFRFAIGASYEAGNDDVFNPFTSLSYGRESASTDLSFELGFRQTDVSDTVISGDFDGDLTPELLLAVGGQRQDLNSRLALEFGRDAPFGATLSYEVRDRNYVDTTNPTLFDGRTNIASARFRFDVNPQVSLSLFATDTSEDEDPGGTDRDTQRFGLGGTLAVTQSLTSSFEISADEVTTTVGATPTVSNDGVSYSFSLTQQVPTGSYQGSYVGRITENGRQETLRFQRSVDLQNGNLSFSVGATRFPTGDTRAVWGLTVGQTFERTRLNASLSQTPTVNDTNDILNTVLSLSVAHDLSPISSLESGFSWREVDTVGGIGQDSRRFDFNVTYRRDIGQDWDFSGGIRYRRQESDTATDVESNSVFFGVSKTLSWRP